MTFELLLFLAHCKYYCHEFEHTVFNSYKPNLNSFVIYPKVVLLDHREFIICFVLSYTYIYVCICVSTHVCGSQKTISDVNPYKYFF